MTERLLYLLRHATAQDRELPIPDAERALVPKGRRQMRQVAEYCARQELKPDLLLASPMRRARQTAGCLRRYLQDCGAITTVDWLSTQSTTAETMAGLRDWWAGHEQTPWLVGHEPGLSELLATLTGAPAGAFVLKKASLTCVALAAEGPLEGSGRLLWTLPCRLMG